MNVWERKIFSSASTHMEFNFMVFLSSTPGCSITYKYTVYKYEEKKNIRKDWWCSLKRWHWINLLMWNRTFDSFVVNSSSQLTEGILFLMFIATILAILSNNSQKNHISYFYHFHSTFLPYMEVDNSMQINCRNIFQHMNSITEIPRNKKQQLLSFFLQ